MCELFLVLARVINLYCIIMFIYALVSWIPDIRGRWTDYLAAVVEPVVAPVRRLIPPVGGLDLSFLIVLIVLQILARMLTSYGYSCYY